MATPLGFAAPSTGLAERACYIACGGLEKEIPHIDIGVCPGTQMEPEEGFCRVGSGGSAVLVRTFRRTDAELRPARVDRYEANDSAGRFSVSYGKP